MKTKTKKLFLSLFAFASLAITACSGNNGGSSGAGDSSGSGTTSSESGSGSDTSTTSEADVDTNLYVKVDNGEEQTIAYDEDEGTYTIGPVELTTSQVIEIYIKEDGVKQSALDIIDVETGSAAYLDVDEDEGTVSVTSDGTYTFVFTYDDGELILAITKEVEPTTYSATLTEGDLGTNLLVHVYNYDGGVIDVVPTINSKTVSFLVDDPTLTNFIVTRLKPGESTLGEDWVNVERQSRELTLTASGVNFTWAPKADDNYHLWGSTDGTNWGELGKFTETAGVYTATVTLAKDTEFVFHLEAYSTEDAGWRNFADLVGTGVTGNFKAKGGTGADNNNIIVDTAGEYTFTVTNEHKVQVGGTTPIANVNYLDLFRGSIETKTDLVNHDANEYKVTGVELQVGDVFSFCVHVSDTDEWVKFDDIRDTTDPSVEAKFKSHVDPDPLDPSNGNFEVVTAGSFDFYVAKDGSYVFIADTPAPAVVTATVAGSPLAMEKKATPDSGKAESWQSEDVDLVKDQEIVISVNGTPVELWREEESPTSYSNVNERPSSSKVSAVTVHNNADDAKVYVHRNNDGTYGIWVTGYSGAAPTPTFLTTYKLAYGSNGGSETTWGWEDAVAGSAVAANPTYSDQAKYTVNLSAGQAFKLRPESTGDWYGFAQLDTTYSWATEGTDNNIIVGSDGEYEVTLRKVAANDAIQIHLERTIDEARYLWGISSGDSDWSNKGTLTESGDYYVITKTFALNDEFVIHAGDSDWRNATLLTGSDVTAGNVAAKGGTGGDKNNIVVKVAGEYTIKVSKTKGGSVIVGEEAAVVAVTFTVNYNTYGNGDIYIVGSFNGWTTADANYKLACSGTENWSGTFNFHEGDVIEYKFYRSGSSAGYEGGSNRNLTVTNPTPTQAGSWQ